MTKAHYFTPSSESAPAALRRLERHHSWRPEAGLRTGLKQFDDITGGLPLGGLTMVAGRPAVGKMLLATMIAHETLLRGKEPNGVAIFSLSLSNEALMLRFLSLASKVSLHKLRNGFFLRKQWGAIQSAATHLAETHLHIDDAPHLTPGDIVERSRALADEMRSRNEALSLILIDCLQLMRCRTGRIGQWPREIAKAGRLLKKLARDTGAAVLVLCGTAPVESDVQGAGRPTLVDLDAAASMERVADLVILLHRELWSKRNPKPEDVAELIVVKHRGPTFSIPVRFRPEIPIFESSPPDSDDLWVAAGIRRT